MDKKDAEQYEASLYLTFTTLKKQKKQNTSSFHEMQCSSHNFTLAEPKGNGPFFLHS